nr:uncharacterized protein K02A2.6-like [Aedes albopictus]
MIQEEDLKVFHRKRDELSIEVGVLLLGLPDCSSNQAEEVFARRAPFSPPGNREDEEFGQVIFLVAIPGQRNRGHGFGSIGTLVSDNGTAFSSEEFQDFCSSRGIKHLRTAPYSPCSNGAAENAVKTAKNAMKKLSSDPAFQRKSVSLHLSAYLEMYRATKHATTGESPFKLMFGREMRIRFDKLKVNHEKRQREKIEEHHLKQKRTVFQIGETVYARDYRNPKKPLWVRAKIVKKIGAVLYECVSDDLGIIKGRSHQLLKYPIDDYGDEARQPTSADTEERARQQPPPAGSYVTRYNRVVLPQRRLGEE